MPSYRSHDRREYMEPERHNEMSKGIPSAEQARASQERAQGGNGIAPGARLVPALGGKALRGRTKLTHNIESVPVDDKLKRRARFMRKRTCAELARNVGAGQCGIIASALVKLASEDMALREAALEAGQVDMARKLGESGRGHLLYSREICAKDAAAHSRAPADPLKAFMPAAKPEGQP